MQKYFILLVACACCALDGVTADEFLAKEDPADSGRRRRRRDRGEGSPARKVFHPETWLKHVQEDLLPYYVLPDALGLPQGNYPTFRDLDGKRIEGGAHYPRIIARQVHTYCAAFMITGNTSLLAFAKAGVDWLLAHAWDEQHGGWYSMLDAEGKPDLSKSRAQVKAAQDFACVAEGLAAWYFVTRDARAEAKILETRDILMEGALWNQTENRVKDAVSLDMNSEVDLWNNGRELTAQLDVLDAFLLLGHSVLNNETRNSQILADMKRLADILVDGFFADGVFWNLAKYKGNWEALKKYPWLVDFGHSLKSLRMVFQVNKHLPDHPFHAFLEEHLKPQLQRAYNTSSGRWAHRPQNATAAAFQPGSWWWSWAECDQAAAAVIMQGRSKGVGKGAAHGGRRRRRKNGGYEESVLRKTADNWFSFVDTSRPSRGVMPYLDGNGNGIGNPDSSRPSLENDGKANQWKNGFHEMRHALTMYLHGHWQEGTTPKLHFAPPASAKLDEVSMPAYIYESKEKSRVQKGNLDLGGVAHSIVEVSYSGIW
eukprot:TRINITY_DN96119_c0_g1_i1.p1 TRINITY_DN96119_c0_g1~~TRINITY_DN96119_c0_g1_i1.p1  ORF type:complete len:541 (-),score=112.45 TRINITY_DN96119_c0_g1_i1:351-1973(-)